LALFVACFTGALVEGFGGGGVTVEARPAAAESSAGGFVEVEDTIAIVVFFVEASFFGIFGDGEVGDTITPQEFAQGVGLGFLDAPFAGADLLEESARARFSLSLSLRACSGEAAAFYTITFIL
jgi:hypothetical protein